MTLYITQVSLAFWLFLAYDLLEARRTIDVIVTKFFPQCFKMTESFENLDNILRDWEKDKGQNKVLPRHWTAGRREDNNSLLTEREGRTGKYWPEAVTVWTEHREVRTKTTEGQYSPVRLEQARLVSSLLYGTRLMLYFFLSKHFRSVKFNGLPARDDVSNSERTSYHASWLWKQIYWHVLPA